MHATSIESVTRGLNKILGSSSGLTELPLDFEVGGHPLSNSEAER